MIGGELLAKGSSSCVFKPNIPCTSSDNVNDNKITKIVYSKKSKAMFFKEKKMNKKIESISNYDKWAIIFNQFCKSPNNLILSKYDKDIGLCINKGISNFNKTSYSLTGDYGGDTLHNYFKLKFKNINSTKTLEFEFIKLMVMMEPLFEGLVKLYTNGISHNDIKYNNIIYKNESDGFRYIDFGLSSFFKDKHNFSKRSKKEANTSRLYLFYPLDYLYFYINKKNLYKETVNQRKNKIILSYIYRVFNMDLNKEIKDIINNLKNNNINEHDMISKIDTYSLGILIPLLFIQESNIITPYDKSNIILDFYLLFKDMCNPLPHKRPSPLKLLKLFKNLLKKHSF